MARVHLLDVVLVSRSSLTFRHAGARCAAALWLATRELNVCCQLSGTKNIFHQNAVHLVLIYIINTCQLENLEQFSYKFQPSVSQRFCASKQPHISYERKTFYNNI